MTLITRPTKGKAHLKPGSMTLVTLQDLSPPAKVHYLYLLPYKEISWSRRTIGERLGFLKSVTQNSLNELQDGALLAYVTTPRPGRVTPFYLLADAKPAQWQAKRRELPTRLLDARPSTKAAYLYLRGSQRAYSTDEVKDTLGMSYQSVYRALRQLEDAGLATHEGENPQRFSMG